MNITLNFRASLLRSARMMSDKINALLLPFNLNYSLWQVLYVIQHTQGCTSIEIAEYLNVSKPSIAKRVYTLMQLDLLDHIETHDKRQKKLILSPLGQTLFAQCTLLIDQFEQSLTKSLDAQSLNHSTQLLNQIIQQLEPFELGEPHE